MKSGKRDRERLLAWFASEHARLLLSEERLRTGERIGALFGYHAVQLGALGDEHFLGNSRIAHKLIASLSVTESLWRTPGIRCHYAELPLLTNSIDVMVMPHILEFETDPHQVLREAARVLIEDGRLLILGFNPWSLWGLWRFLPGWRKPPPWRGNYISLMRLKDWLKLLNFEITSSECFYFRPPVGNANMLRKLLFFERLGSRCWPWLGGVYLLTAKKRLAPLTPIKLRWRSESQAIAAGIAGTPTGRSSLRECMVSMRLLTRPTQRKIMDKTNK